MWAFSGQGNAERLGFELGTYGGNLTGADAVQFAAVFLQIQALLLANNVPPPAEGTDPLLALTVVGRPGDTRNTLEISIMVIG